MPLQTTCPGCGGPIYVEDRAGMAVCQFCGTRFKVDLDGVAPRLEKDTRPPLSEPEPESEPEPKQDFYSQFQPQEPVEPEPEPMPTPAPSYPPMPTYQPETKPAGSIRSMFGGRVWLVIALVVGALVIGSCVCLVLVSQGVISLFQ